MKPSKRFLSALIAKCHSLDPNATNVAKIIQCKLQIENYAAKMGLYIFEDEILKIDSMIRIAKISHFYNNKPNNSDFYYSDNYDDNGWDYYNSDGFWPNN
jgi:hypothetical protein